MSCALLLAAGCASSPPEPEPCDCEAVRVEFVDREVYVPLPEDLFRGCAQPPAPERLTGETWFAYTTLLQNAVRRCEAILGALEQANRRTP